jgi:hypothetical protein
MTVTQKDVDAINDAIAESDMSTAEACGLLDIIKWEMIENMKNMPYDEDIDDEVDFPSINN